MFFYRQLFEHFIRPIGACEYPTHKTTSMTSTRGKKTKIKEKNAHKKNVWQKSGYWLDSKKKNLNYSAMKTVSIAQVKWLNAFNSFFSVFHLQYLLFLLFDKRYTVPLPLLRILGTFYCFCCFCSHRIYLMDSCYYY